MENFIVEFFNTFNRYIVSLHILSAILLVGGLFAMRFLIKPIIYEIKIPGVRYGTGMKLIKRFLICSVICLTINLVTGSFMSIGLNFSGGNPATNVIVHTLEALWIFISVNFIYMYVKYRETIKYFKVNDYIEIHENLELIFCYVIPLNLTIGIVSMYFGVLLRGY